MSHAVHSKLFSQYKNTKEQLLLNYSTNQYMTVLDQLLYASLVQILDNSDYMQRPVAAIIAWYTLHTKRKISIGDKPEAITNLLQFLICSNPESKLAAFKRAQLERNVTRSIMEDFGRQVRQARKQSLAAISGKDINRSGVVQVVETARRLRLHNRYRAFGIAEVLDYWMELEKQFRGMILEKYIRSILNTANRDYKAYRFQIEIEEFIQNYCAGALRAIDKSSVGDMGTLTIYINAWLKNALQGTVTHFNYTVPYSVPPAHLSSHRVETIDLDDPVAQGLASDTDDFDEENEAQQVILRVRQLAKAVDPTGVGRMLLGIEEYLTPAEIQAIAG